jgi:hypothetical protein
MAIELKRANSFVPAGLASARILPIDIPWWLEKEL